MTLAVAGEDAVVDGSGGEQRDRHLGAAVHTAPAPTPTTTQRVWLRSAPRMRRQPSLRSSRSWSTPRPLRRAPRRHTWWGAPEQATSDAPDLTRVSGFEPPDLVPVRAGSVGRVSDRRPSPRERPHAIDPRPLRFEQGMIAVLLLAGFAFQAELVIPITTVLLAISGAVGPEREPAGTATSRSGVTDQLRPPCELVDRQTLRLAILVETGLCSSPRSSASLGLEPVAWLVALVVTAVAIYDATTGTWIAPHLYWRFARRNRPDSLASAAMSSAPGEQAQDGRRAEGRGPERDGAGLRTRDRRR